MTTAVYWHSDIFLHDAHADHPAMASDRIQNVFNSVSGVPGIQLTEAPLASTDVFRLAHEDEYVDHLLAVAPTTEGMTYSFDSETVMNVHTLRALKLSAGASVAAVDGVLDKTISNAFCVVYAGHHAGENWAEGFCFTNPVAIAAHHALARGVQRLAVVDFDTHSGNGTARCLANEPERVLFAETYQPGYPGTVFPNGTPKHILRTKSRNSHDFMHAWSRHLPKLAAFRPELMLVSAGFDAHMRDPLGVMNLPDTAFHWLMGELLKVTPNVVAVLEGGYHAEATPRCAKLVVNQLVSSSIGE